jgi:hypothetical protein
VRHDDFVASICGRLESLDLEYILVGATACGFYGEPRFTNDVDVLVEIPSWKLRDLLALFPSPEYYASEEAARAALEHGGMIVISHTHTTYKADLIVFHGSRYDECRFSRKRRLGMANGVEVWVAAPEDVILMKLRFYHEGASDKHLRDVTGIIRVIGWSDAPKTAQPGVDRAYVEHWALMLAVKDEWQAILDRLAQFEKP